MAEQSTDFPSIPLALGAAFVNRLTISSAELCKLLPMDAGTLRRHVEAGNIECVRFGFGANAPRRFTREAIVQFLASRSERACPSISLRSPRSTRSTSGGEAGDILALLERRNAEKLRLRSVV